MPLTPDIQRRIAADFSADDAAIAQRIAARRAAHPDIYSDRIVRCALHVAAGDAAVLDRALELAEIDWRDLIVWAEYDNDFDDRKRDLNQPFE